MAHKVWLGLNEDKTCIILALFEEGVVPDLVTLGNAYAAVDMDKATALEFGQWFGKAFVEMVEAEGLREQMKFLDPSAWQPIWPVAVPPGEEPG